MTYNKHLVIVGTARSGTSWLCESIASQKRYRLLFEPEHESKTKKGHLLCDKWIQHRGESVQGDTYLKNIFLNRVNSDWIAQNSNRKFKQHLWPFLPKKYIIKFVRANLLAKYINEGFKIPVIHIIRDPYDVINSQQIVKFPWLYHLSHFSRQEKLVALIKNKFGLDLCEQNNWSDIEKLAIRWCIENVIPLEVNQAYQGKAKVLRYEKLSNDINEFYRLFEEFNLEPVTHLDSLYKRPSSKTHPSKSTLDRDNERGNLNKQDCYEISEVLNRFQTKLYPIEPL